MAIDNIRDFTQISYGSGDLVAGDKILYQGLAPRHLRKITNQVFECLRKGEKESALQKVRTLEDISEDDESHEYLDFLRLILGDLDKDKSGSLFGKLHQRLNASDDPRQIDLLLSALIRIKILLKEEPEARELYENSYNHGIFTRVIFLELLATKDELIAWKTNYETLPAEYLSLVNGLLRVEEAEHARRFLPKIQNYVESPEKEVMQLLVKAVCLTRRVCKINYFLLNQQDKKCLDKIEEETKGLLHEKKVEDGRLLNIIIPIYEYKGRGFDKTTDICWVNRAKWRALYPDFYGRLKASKEEDIGDMSESAKEYLNLTKSKEKQIELEQKIASKSFTTQELFFSFLVTKKRTFASLSPTEVIIENEDDQNIIKFMKAIVACMSEVCDHSIKEEYISTALKELMNDDFDFNSLNHVLVLFFTEQLNRNRLYSTTLLFVEGVMEKRPWYSPVIAEYSYALLKCYKFKTLNDLLDITHDTGRHEPKYWGFKTYSKIYEGDLKRAKKSAEQWLSVDPNSAQALYYYASILINTNDGSIAEFLNGADFSMLKGGEPYTGPILSISAIFMAREKYENLIVGFFANDPINNAVDVTSAYMAEIESHNGENERKVTSDWVDVVKCGIRYNIGSSRELILAVSENCSTTGSQYLASIESSKVKSLLSAENESVTVGSITYSDVEIVPPLIACFQLAAKIRTSINDGNDTFALLETPSDPDEIIAFFENLLAKRDNSEVNEILQSTETPLLFKSRFLNNEISGLQAFNLFTSDEVVKPYLDKRVSYEVKEYVLIDIYTIVYLSLTGMEKLLSNFTPVITRRTLEALKSTLRKMTEQFLRINLNKRKKLSRITEDDFKREYGYCVEALNYIIEIAEIVDDSTIFSTDMPQELSVLSDLLDEDVLNTLMACYSFNYTWLTVDSLLGSWVEKVGIKTLPVENVVADLGKTVPFEKRVAGIRLCLANTLRAPIYQSDVAEFLRFRTNNDVACMLELIKRFGSSLEKNQSLLQAMYMWPIVLIGKLLDPKNTLDISLVESLINLTIRMQISIKDNTSREYRLAVSYFKAKKIVQAERLNMPQLDHIYSKFAFGHFLSLEKVNSHLKGMR